MARFKSAKQRKAVMAKYALFWKGKRMKELGTFDTRKEAETTKGIETTQMEFAELTPAQIRKNFTVRRI